MAFFHQKAERHKKIFAIDTGSSSLKFQLLEIPTEKILVKGIFEKIGSDETIFKLESDTLNEKSLYQLPRIK